MGDVLSSLTVHGREVYMAYHREIGAAGDPIFRALQRVPGRLVTRTRRQLVTGAVYYRSLAFNEYLRLAHIDHRLVSVYQVPDGGAISAI